MTPMGPRTRKIPRGTKPKKTKQGMYRPALAVHTLFLKIVYQKISLLIQSSRKTSPRT